MTAPLGHIDFVIAGSVPVFDQGEAYDASTLTSDELADRYSSAVRHNVGAVEWYWRAANSDDPGAPRTGTV